MCLFFFHLSGWETNSADLFFHSGSAMNVAYGEEEMKRFLEEASQVSQVSCGTSPCLGVGVGVCGFVWGLLCVWVCVCVCVCVYSRFCGLPKAA